MCLLKPSEFTNVCAHDECKNFRMLNRPACIYSLNPTSKSSSAQQGASVLGPRLSNYSEDLEDEDAFVLNKKKVKVQEQRPVAAPVMQVAQPMYAPYVQNQMSMVDHSNMQNISYIPVQQSYQPHFQNFAPNMDMRPAMDLNIQSMSTPSSAGNFQRNFNIEEYMNQFQSKLSEVLVSQNKMLIDLREKNDLVQDTLACLINEVSALKQTVKRNDTESASFIKNKTVELNQQYSKNSGEIASSESLLDTLYGPNTNFQYQLVFRSELTLPLYRERNFKFTVLLTDKDGNHVKNCNRIPLSLAIYTSENPPKFVDVNTSGNKILKGVIDKDMVDGTVTFDKIQIKEVTSHFRNGWVFFVVYPKTAGTVFNRATPAGNAVLVDQTQVRPLVLERVVVKAKKLKETKAEDAEDDSEIVQEL